MPSQSGKAGDRRAFLRLCGGVLAAGAAGPPASGRQERLVRFGHTDLRVSRLCQGTAFRKLSRDADDPGAQKVLRRCLDLGVNFFDSSNAYGWGGAERALGKAIAGRRDQVVVCTKVSPSPHPGTAPGPKPALTREFIFREAEGSLKRLNTDYIDLYLIHSPDGVTPPESVADSMDALVRAGKIRYWGVSNFEAPQVKRLVELAERKEKVPVAGLQDYYNLIAGDRRTFMERELFPLIHRGRLGLMAFSPLGEGRLAPGRPVDPATPWVPVVKALDEVARETGATRPQVCVAWVLSHPEVTSVLAGAEQPEHVDDNFRGTQLVLPQGALRKLTAASDAMGRQAG